MRGVFSSARGRNIALVSAALCLLALAGVLLLVAPNPSAQAFFGSLFNGGQTANQTTATTAATALASEKPGNNINSKQLPALPVTLLAAYQQSAADVCATPTPFPAPNSTTTVPTAVPTATNTPSVAPTPTIPVVTQANVDCNTCPVFSGNNPSQPAIAAALETAANSYGLPIKLLDAVAWQESNWHENVRSCDGGIGLMQIQYYTYPWLNTVSIAACGLNATSYSPFNLQGNADLGAKLLKYLDCFYGYQGSDTSATTTNPGQYSIAWYYQQAGLQYPDTLNADGSTNANSLCAAVYNDPNRPWYPALRDTGDSLTQVETWACPYTATAGDNTLMDMVLSAYNEGAGYTDQNGIQNWNYVQGVADKIAAFETGALPVAS
ncbi:MAG TPA: transglycosylase SLT domain-containing protein [Ktedonobacterales bacterium]|nr:transglycosylase SLT domain-containing protein [Ktedonobacterales bacterium]